METEKGPGANSRLRAENRRLRRCYEELGEARNRALRYVEDADRERDAFRAECLRLESDLQAARATIEEVMAENARVVQDAKDAMKVNDDLVAEHMQLRATIAKLEVERVQWAERDKRREELYAAKMAKLKTCPHGLDRRARCALCDGEPETT
jgi:chromosome segregation ATPase